MKTHLFLLPLLFISFSCKKDKDAPSNIPAPVTEVPVGAISNYDALFSCIKLNSKTTAGGYAAAGTQVAAYYSSTLINNETYPAAMLQNIGGVILNSVVLKTKSSFATNYYNDTTGTDFTLPHNWHVLGSNVVDSFSYANSNPPPDFPLANRIPDSLSIQSGLTVRLKGTTGCDLIRVLLTSGPGSTQSVLKLTAGSDSLIVFAPADLQPLSATTTGYITIQLFKDNYRKINGKKINFRSGVAYANSAFKIKQ